MEIKFNSTPCRFLRRVAGGVQTREQTQELRLPEAMPDIGRVLGCWGQVVLRGKEWRNGSMGVSGGVMARVLYAPEDGSEPQTLESWVPFQMSWELPETERDGFICAEPKLKSIDARSTSARKLMLRANVSVQSIGMENAEEMLMEPAGVPEDVELLKNVYPMELPQEFGEKQLQIEEELPSGGTYPAVERLLRYELTPVITEQKVMSSRLVFRGKGMVHLVYFSGGEVCCRDEEISFSQYADLDREYAQNASAAVTPVVTNLEMDAAEGKLSVKCGLAVQFVIFDRVMAEVTEDAYSPRRSVRLEHRELGMPARLEQRSMELTAEQTLSAEGTKAADISFLPEHIRVQRSGDDALLTVAGTFQVLYYDPAGNLQSGAARFEQELAVPADAEAAVEGAVSIAGMPQVSVTGQGMAVSAPLKAELSFHSRGGMAAVTGMELGESAEADPSRPSLVLQRFDSGRLWDIAKACGSRVDAIRAANGIQAEPEKGQLLLIPVS